ncbi:hypothetical protein AWB69_01355 [Caballeronia udeis]|uniref:Uncharacterized protein n=1 Tax=Caballeronia udeis TaxID=1232866 RepID=A0A158FMD9_9BURK|nr:hypothetical protein AWB69_01355 [Caballeronia udeis]
MNLTGRGVAIWRRVAMVTRPGLIPARSLPPCMPAAFCSTKAQPQNADSVPKHAIQSPHGTNLPPYFSLGAPDGLTLVHVATHPSTSATPVTTSAPFASPTPAATTEHAAYPFNAAIKTGYARSAIAIAR